MGFINPGTIRVVGYPHSARASHIFITWMLFAEREGMEDFAI